MSQLAGRLDAARATLFAAIDAAPSEGRRHAADFARAIDDLVRSAFAEALAAYPNHNPSSGEKVSLVALGGYGREEMAPFSDVDLMFLVPQPRTPWCEQVIEATLYALWDAKLKVGQAIRTPSELIGLARSDLTVRTAMLEGRFLAGDRALYDEADGRFRREVVVGTAADFVSAKLAERDERHEKFGDSRYLVEPNVKNGKGGLRDLHTLLWVGRYVHGIHDASELVTAGLLTPSEYARFDRAMRFFWSVRCLLHRLAGRAEERLSFAHQRELATALSYADRPGKSAVERFMHMYFLQARTVGDLTGQFLAQLDAQLGEQGRRFALPTFLRRPRRLGGFVIDRGRLAIPHERFFREDPRRLLSLFALAAREKMEIHPSAMRAATRDSHLAEQVRDDPQANACFLEVLTTRDHPELVLRWMNEANVFGRFVPDFRRVVGQMQFDMYHHYTVDEHTIRAVGLLAALERGELGNDHPVATALFKQIASRRVLYVAVLLHDIAKGRKGDHSILGAEVARELCPRFGLDAGETDTVAWLVRQHLLLSRTAFKRDLADPQTIDDLAAEVQSPERLRLLLLLTVVDIRAVGPGVWTEWKRKLLVSLYELAEERLRPGYRQRGRTEEVAARQEALTKALGWSDAAARQHADRLTDSYWLAEPADWILDNARQIAAAESGPEAPSVRIEGESDTATRVSIFARDRPGLFYRICAGLAAGGASIIGARIHTTRDGKALDNLLIQDAQGRPYVDRRRRTRLVKAVLGALEGSELPVLPPVVADHAFTLVPSVTIADNASRRFTVVEVRAFDRAGLLAALALAIHRADMIVHSAHIATYGEKAVDVFYLTDGDGRKLGPAQVAALRPALLAAAADRPVSAAA
ncbi:[protein-PII] uridylyltransferase [Sphingomonas rosea]|uniref:Bifunctional uridylyltransferase/uridylyl-removing enzyme n=1 Tax=Sphingomonas rosea TaxID=335605 RepID=A0ABP7TWH6_9SPHN